MRNISSRGPGFVALLLFLPAFIFVASLFWHIAPAPAQVQTFTYTGEAFNQANCGNDATHTYVPGNITGSLTLTGLASGFQAPSIPRAPMYLRSPRLPMAWAFLLI